MLSEVSVYDCKDYVFYLPGTNTFVICFSLELWQFCILKLLEVKIYYLLK